MRNTSFLGALPSLFSSIVPSLFSSYKEASQHICLEHHTKKRNIKLKLIKGMFDNTMRKQEVI